jgi:hypothetical protein
MIKPLRKYHYVLWRILVIILPLVLIFSIIFHQVVSVDRRTVSDFNLSIEREGDSVSVVQILVLNPLRYPSCEVRAIVSGDELLLGLLSHRGEYTFRVKEKLTGLRLYDALGKKEILKHQMD